MIDRIKNIRFGFREDYDPDKRIVKQNRIKIYNDEYFISTVDLGMNYSFIENYDEYFAKDGITYHNVEFISTIVGCNDNQYKINGNNIKIFDFFIIFVLVFLLILCLYKIFSLFIRGVK